MTDETKRWFVEKVAQNPEYIHTTFLPAIEKVLARADLALRDAIRKDDPAKMKYRMGWLDGAQDVCSVIDGLKLSDGKPAEPGLMARIFQRGEP